MKGKQVVAILFAIAVLGAAAERPAQADDTQASYVKRSGKLRQYRALAERQIVYYEYCRGGWWQTLKYGKVRPHWAVHCGDVRHRAFGGQYEP